MIVECFRTYAAACMYANALNYLEVLADRGNEDAVPYEEIRHKISDGLRYRQSIRDP